MVIPEVGLEVTPTKPTILENEYGFGEVETKWLTDIYLTENNLINPTNVAQINIIMMQVFTEATKASSGVSTPACPSTSPSTRARSTACAARPRATSTRR